MKFLRPIFAPRMALRVAVSGVVMLATLAAAFPALALCCCTEFPEPMSREAAPAADSDHANCHAEPATDSGVQIKADQRACICSDGHSTPAFVPVKAVHVPAPVFGLSPPAPLGVLPAPSSPNSWALSEDGVDPAALNLHIVHCAFLI